MKRIFDRIATQIQTDRVSCLAFGLTLFGMALMVAGTQSNSRPATFADIPVILLFAGLLGNGVFFIMSALKRHKQ